MTAEPTSRERERTSESDPTVARTDRPVVLLVEDEADVADMYREWLAGDFDVTVARSGAEALGRIDGTVDVVLLDRKLPDTSGEAVLEVIRRREIPCQVVVVSAIDPGVDVLDVGFDDYLTKPASEAGLTAAVERSITRTTYTTTCQEFMALASKLATLEANMDIEELEESSEYTDLRDRLADMAGDIETMEVGDEEFQDLYQTKLNVLLENTRAANSNH